MYTEFAFNIQAGSTASGSAIFCRAAAMRGAELKMQNPPVWVLSALVRSPANSPGLDTFQGIPKKSRSAVRFRSSEESSSSQIRSALDEGGTIPLRLWSEPHLGCSRLYIRDFLDVQAGQDLWSGLTGGALRSFEQSPANASRGLEQLC